VLSAGNAGETRVKICADVLRSNRHYVYPLVSPCEYAILAFSIVESVCVLVGVYEICAYVFSVLLSSCVFRARACAK
jgi:hypothetical protein